MPNPEDKKRFAFDRPRNYRIRVRGFLDESWSDRLGGLRITNISQKEKAPVAELVGQMRDQAELDGLLNTLYELHMTLLSIEYLDED